MDILNGSVVHGRFGRRDQYRPIESRLCAGSLPMEVARAFRQNFGLSEIYLADLDGITHGKPNVDLYRELANDGFKLWIDPGLRRWSQRDERLDPSHFLRLVVGSETLESRDDLRKFVETWGDESIIFSVDQRDGTPLTRVKEWSGQESSPLIRDAYEAGVRNFLLLDLARVGSGQGIGTESMVRRVLEIDSSLMVYVGGGVRGPSDLQAATSQGVAGVLVASALHDGRLTASDIEQSGRKSTSRD